MRASRAWAALFLGLSLAGCLGVGQQPPADGQPLAAPILTPAGLPAGTPSALRHYPCVEQFAYLPVPMQVAQGVVPEGFAPLPYEPTGQLAMTVAVGFTCAQTEGDEGFTLDELRTLGLVLAVTPPEAYLADGIQYYVIPLGGITSSEEMGEVYAAWNFGPVRVAPLDFEVTQTLDVARNGRVAGQDGDFAMELVTASLGPVEAQEPNAFRVFGLVDGKVVNAVDWSWPKGADAMETGTAVLRVTGGLAGTFAPVQPGIGYQYWGAYEYHLAYVDLRAD